MPLFHNVDAAWLTAWLKDKFGGQYFQMSPELRDLYIQRVAHELLFICDEIELNAARAAWKDMLEDAKSKLNEEAK